VQKHNLTLVEYCVLCYFSQFLIKLIKKLLHLKFTLYNTIINNSNRVKKYSCAATKEVVIEVLGTLSHSFSNYP